MKTEITLLVQISLFTALMWMPYILNRMLVRGITATVGYPPAPAAMAPWAERLQKAHANAVENLAVFAALVLAAHALGISNPTTVLACQLYVGARLVHALAYTFAIAWIRTLAFLGGFAAQALLAWQILA